MSQQSILTVLVALCKACDPHIRVKNSVGYSGDIMPNL